jgi:arginase family enzyme
MLSGSIRILNFDDSVIKQKQLFSKYRVEIVDLTDLGPKARLWFNKAAKRKIEQRVSSSSGNSVTFLGSGDFHHASLILIEQIKDPISLIVFDFHPDWDTLPPKFGCGSWVTQALKKKNILKTILLGPSSSDISTWGLQSANLASLKGNRVEIYPYAHSRSKVFLKNVPQNVSLEVKKGFFCRDIYWNELKGKALKEFFLSLLKNIPTKQVYVSIDKDCLSREYALTNWESGLFSLDELLLMLNLIKENLDIVGMDISGDYSPILTKGLYKSLCSKIDHPGQTSAQKAGESLITATNEATNLKILEAIS